MTIDEIKSVSILQWMRLNNYGDGIRKGRNYFFCSPLRSERTPSRTSGVTSAATIRMAAISSTSSSSLIRHGLSIRCWLFLNDR